MENIHTKELLTKLSELIKSMDYEDDPEGKWNDDEIIYSIVKETEWEDQGRRAYKTMVFKFPGLFPDTDVYVQAELERTGDYYQGYDFEDTVFSLVSKHEKTVVKTFYKEINV